LRSPADKTSEKDFYLSEILETKRLLEITERDLVKAEADSKAYRLKHEELLSQMRKNSPPWPTEREVEDARRDLDDSERNLRFVEDVLMRYQDEIKRLEKSQVALEKKEETAEKNMEEKRKLQVDLDEVYESLREVTALRDRMLRERRRPVLK